MGEPSFAGAPLTNSSGFSNGTRRAMSSGRGLRNPIGSFPSPKSASPSMLSAPLILGGFLAASARLYLASLGSAERSSTSLEYGFPIERTVGNAPSQDLGREQFPAAVLHLAVRIGAMGRDPKDLAAKRGGAFDVRFRFRHRPQERREVHLRDCFGLIPPVFSMDIALANSFATCGRHSQEATGFASGAEANRA